jgi:hypothetical protein
VRHRRPKLAMYSDILCHVAVRMRCLRHSQLPPLRSFVHTRSPVPSSAYLDRTRGPDVSTSSTPNNLSPSQRRVLEAALRVDQAGEVAANYIYEGQLATLRRDPVASALIQASSTLLLVPHHINILC